MAFEDDAAARGRARGFLAAAKKYGIVPIGFITGQLQSQTNEATAGRLVIEATRDAVRRSRPTGTRFRSLGPHRLRGLRDQQVLLQVEAAGLPARFPPPRTDDESSLV